MDYTGSLPDGLALCVFDLDGTLIDSLADLAASVNWILGRSGFPSIGEAVVRLGVGNGARNLLIRSFAASALSAGTAGAGLVLPSGDLLEGILAEYRAHYDEHCTDQTRLYPGIRAWLEALSRNGKKLAVLTNKPERATKLLLESLEIGRFFDVIAGPETFNSLKPDPAGLRAIMAQCGARSGETVMIGDSIVDVETGRNAGVVVCGITGGLGDDEALRASKPDIIIERRNS